MKDLVGFQGKTPVGGVCLHLLNSSHLRVACCLLLPVVQLVVGISHPSWISLPFFICSCVGLVDWSLTSNFLGLFRWWRLLFLYAGFSILVLYVYQLPINFPGIFVTMAKFLGLYKVYGTSEWGEVISGISLVVFYFMLSSVKYDMDEMDSIMSMHESSLTEQLLPSKHSFFIRESRSGVRHTNVLLRGSVFRNFSINFFTYGFPVLLLALSFWSFSFASVCAFALLAYVGYVLYAFPSLLRLHRLNGLLLVFILLWAASTYIFNVAFTYFNKKLRKDMEIWETIGLWHYPIPGFFLLAQFCLGVFVAMCNLVNNSVILYLSDVDGRSSSDDRNIEEKEDTKVLIVATIAWGLRKSSRAITLVLILLLAMKPGFIHSVYMIFFMVYLLSHSVSRKIRQALILFCEAHFTILYILQLNIISNTLEHGSSLIMEILSQLGLLGDVTSWDFLKIASLLCFCAVQNHGFKVLFSFSSILQNTPFSPLGFSILKAGLKKSVLLSVYASRNVRSSQSISLHEKRVGRYLSEIGQRFLSVYRSYGTYIAFITILLTVYLVSPNYISFGYLLFLLFWIIGRQIVEKTKRRLWFPLKVYATLVCILTYSLSIFTSFETWLSKIVNLYPDLGFDPEASLFHNVWESLAVLVVMQLYSYERRQSGNNGIIDNLNLSEQEPPGIFRRFVIWHSEKILSIAVFYASISPISAFGFLYLLGLVICSTLPKASRVPSKLFLVYTGLLVTSEYLFQMWGKHAQMFPGQKYSSLSLFLGFQSFNPGFWGLESGLRGKVLVIVACTLQYNAFHWLKKMPSSLVNKGKWEEPCHLFVPTGENSMTMNEEESNPSTYSSLVSVRQRSVKSKSCPSFGSDTCSTGSVPSKPAFSGSGNKPSSFSYMWGSSMESHKWNRRRILALRKERFDVQMNTMKIYLKFWLENLFNLFGLEINMIALLLASFAVLNIISMLYIISLVTCILMKREAIRKLWPIFVFSFASILILEYFSIWRSLMPWIHSPWKADVHCHECWRSSNLYFNYCTKCWLGIIVDDPRMLVSYYVVFIISSFKLRADRLENLTDSHTYRQIISDRQNASVWRGLSIETKILWTVLDYIRLYFYCHLVDIVLALILITGTLEYDVLHLGYLGFALVFFRTRLEILKKKNKIFKFLRMYNLALIILSLAYQSPFLGNFSAGKCETIDYIYEVIGFYKYDYGFRITSRSALVEIVIFLLVSVQSYIFSSREFEYVSRYLEAEQIGAVVREQEKRAARKTAHLHYLRKSEEQKHQRNLQVEKMKSEMLNLQIQLHSMSTGPNLRNAPPESGSIRRRRHSPNCDKSTSIPDNENIELENQNHIKNTEVLFPFDVVAPCKRNDDSTSQLGIEKHDSPLSGRSESPSAIENMEYSEITEVDDGDDSPHPNARDKPKVKARENPLISAVQMIGDGVSQVQSFGNQAVHNIVSFLNIENEESDSNENSSGEDRICDEIDVQCNMDYQQLDRTSSIRSVNENPTEVSLQIGKIFRFIWAQMRANNDVVCYCCFVLVFLWNFSLLSMFYIAALFMYALCVSTGPSYLFWVIMLMYTEFYILIQYLYQIIIQHCGLSINMSIFQKLGFPSHKITSSFVGSMLPLFVLYIVTLLQSSITAKDGEWASVTEFNIFERKKSYHEEYFASHSWRKAIWKLFVPLMNVIHVIGRSFLLYWRSLTKGSESPPYFVQVSMEVNQWPEDGIQPEKIESQINKLLDMVHEERFEQSDAFACNVGSKVRVQSIERSQDDSNIALAVFEVVHVSPLTEGYAEAQWYKSLSPAADVATEISMAQNLGMFEEIGFPYPVISVIGGGKREIDLYAYIFGADLAVFFLVAIFYQSVIKNNSKFLDVYQLEDQFPKEFVFILMVIFFLIVLDRIIYLCSFATVKVIFYVFNLVLFTYSVTEYAWYMVPAHRYAGEFALRAIYLTKVISLALQALQIRYGIPHKSTLYRQYLTSKVAQVNYLGFRLYRALPFLYELRCVLDWSCTTTSLTMYDWLKLEDIYASLYLVKCDALLNRATHKQGEKQTKMTKCCSGICLFFILICVIWAPMLMYSSGNPTNIANPIIDASVQIDITTLGGRLTLYQTTLCEKYDWEQLDAQFKLDRQRLLEPYNVKDIQLICCQADASTLWLVPPAVQERFGKFLYQDMNIIFMWVFTRDRPKGKEVVKHQVPVQDPPSPSEVEEVLNGKTSSFNISSVYPRYFRVTGSGEVRYLEQTVESVSGELFMNHGSTQWWSFYDLNASDICGDLTGPMAIIVSEETPQGFLGETLSKFSIWSLYITFVLAVGRFIRLQCADLRMRIPYENLPSCDRLLAICEDIYAARAEGELGVEEVLYWTLVKIYRSPHMLLEYTKPD
ncbi:hypothetical protein QJS10_CPA16g01436 [Acorus calamus]|uniref:Piezo non-specific cation channel R-Ras-binding domain-containing protein n=1 Tax=Acorus calamus TaxID=4465 RepID=A0AAV9CZW3_ACOCL|nr:hypothetical protein QJS10_CPA16g01436 [Acorus calamus]